MGAPLQASRGSSGRGKYLCRNPAPSGSAACVADPRGSVLTLCCPPGHFDYQYGYRKFEGSDGSRTQKYASNITYYFDNISSAELYSVDQELLKDYIKRQM